MPRQILPLLHHQHRLARDHAASPRAVGNPQGPLCSTGSSYISRRHFFTLLPLLCYFTKCMQHELCLPCRDAFISCVLV
eukprot:1105685-Amphidinium_carterae.1